MRVTFSVLYFLAASLGLALPIALGIARSNVHDVIRAKAAVGTFVSSSSTAGGLLANDTTTVQSTTGSLAVTGQFAAMTGVPLELRRYAIDGLQLCAADTCVPAVLPAGVELTPVPHSESFALRAASRYGRQELMMWFLLGMLPLMLIAVLHSVARDVSRRDHA